MNKKGANRKKSKKKMKMNWPREKYRNEKKWMGKNDPELSHTI